MGTASANRPAAISSLPRWDSAASRLSSGRAGAPWPGTRRRAVRTREAGLIGSGLRSYLGLASVDLRTAAPPQAPLESDPRMGDENRETWAALRAAVVDVPAMLQTALTAETNPRQAVIRVARIARHLYA